MRANLLLHKSSYIIELSVCVLFLAVRKNVRAYFLSFKKPLVKIKCCIIHHTNIHTYIHIYRERENNNHPYLIFYYVFTYSTRTQIKSILIMRRIYIYIYLKRRPKTKLNSTYRFLNSFRNEYQC
jgi:hypothetical protein